MYNRHTAVALITVLTAGPCLAAPTDQEAIIVTASRIPTSLENTASSVTVITADDIHANQWRTVSEALAAQPGMRLAASGKTGVREQFSLIFDSATLLPKN
jgi:vitamin B12 transporter